MEGGREEGGRERGKEGGVHSVHAQHCYNTCSHEAVMNLVLGTWGRFQIHAIMSDLLTTGVTRACSNRVGNGIQIPRWDPDGNTNICFAVTRACTTGVGNWILQDADPHTPSCWK